MYNAGMYASLGLYTRFVYLDADVHESTIRSLPRPPAFAHPSAILLHDYWAIYDFPSDLAFVC